MKNVMGAKIETQRLCKAYKMLELKDFKTYCRNTIAEKPEYLNVIIDGLMNVYGIKQNNSTQEAAEIFNLIMSLKLQTMLIDKEIDFVDQLENKQYFIELFINREI